METGRGLGKPDGREASALIDSISHWRLRNPPAILNVRPWAPQRGPLTRRAAAPPPFRPRLMTSPAHATDRDRAAGSPDTDIGVAAGGDAIISATADRTARAHFLGSSTVDRLAARRALVVRQRAEAHAADVGLPVRVDNDRRAFPPVLGQVPHHRARTVPADARRAHALEARIRTLLFAARADRSPLPPRVPDDDTGNARPLLARVLERGCAHCGGHCCRGGRDHAHLDLESIRQWVHCNPDSTDDDVVAAYLSHLPAESLEGSCIYHTSAGCALPRPSRSDTCNRYLCPDLSRLTTTLWSSGGTRVFLSAVHHGELRDGLLIDAEHVHLIPLRPWTSEAGSSPS